MQLTKQNGIFVQMNEAEQRKSRADSQNTWLSEMHRMNGHFLSAHCE